MAAFLVYVFLKGPAWLRALVWLCLIAFLFYGCFSAVTNIRNITERPVPAHAHTARTHRTALVRR